MSYPTIYAVAYSYTGFQQAQQGTSAFPGTQLDADLAGLKASIASVNSFVQGVMRSDGALNNGIVTYDSLSTQLQAALVLAGSSTIVSVGAALLGGVNKGILYNNAGVLATLAATPNGVLVTSATGTPSISASLPPVNITSSGGVSSSAAIPRMFSVIDGSVGAGYVTTQQTPTVLISRIEKITQNGLSDGSDGPALYAVVTAHGTQQGVAISGLAYGGSTGAAGDVVGIYGVAVQAGTAGTNTAYGGFFNGKATTPGSGALALQLQTQNDTGIDKPYNPATLTNGSPFVIGVDNAYASFTGNLGQAAHLIRAGGGQWDVGMAFFTGAVRTADIRTDTAATYVLFAGAASRTHGIDVSAATFSGYVFKSRNFSVIDSNGEVFIGAPGTAAGVISFAGQTSGATTLSAPAVAGGAIILPSGSTTLAGTSLIQIWTGVQLLANGNLSLLPATGSGQLLLRVGNGNANASLTFPDGTTDFSATGGAGQVVKQLGAGLAFTVGTVGVSELGGLGTGVATALGINVGSAGAPVVLNGALGTPSSGTVTNLTGTAGININGTVGATTPATGAFTTVAASTSITSPLHVGGSGTTGTQLTLQTTTGVGTTDAFAFKGGNNGATTFATLQTGSFNIQTAASYNINGASVLSGTTLGASVVSSSLTSFGNSPAFVTPNLGAATATTINGVTIDNNAYSLTSPTPVSTGGAFTLATATVREKKIGKRTHVIITVVVTTMGGSASGAILVTVPTAALNPTSGTFGDVNNGGVAGTSFINGTTVTITPITIALTNHTYQVMFDYES